MSASDRRLEVDGTITMAAERAPGAVFYRYVITRGDSHLETASGFPSLDVAYVEGLRQMIKFR